MAKDEQIWSESGSFSFPPKVALFLDDKLTSAKGRQSFPFLGPFFLPLLVTSADFTLSEHAKNTLQSFFAFSFQRRLFILLRGTIFVKHSAEQQG